METNLDREFWLIILTSWIFDEMEVMEKWAEKIEGPPSYGTIRRDEDRD